VDHAVEMLAAHRGREGRSRREAVLTALFLRATPAEAAFLVKCIRGEMRHGVNEGLLLESVARATDTPPDSVRRAAMFLGDVGEVVARAFEGGRSALDAVAPRLFHPLKPMLGQTAQSLEEAWAATPRQFALEFKLDGMRIQIHAERDEVRLFSRRLHDVTDSLPDIVAEVRSALAVRRAILEGEIIAMDVDGRPRSAQDLLQRTRRLHAVEEAQREVPLRLFIFDLLLDGEDCLVERAYHERWNRLLMAHGGLTLVPRCLPRALAEAKAFQEDALEMGHEGVMLKRLDAPYVPGLRSAGWLALTPSDRADLVIVAAEYGDGRRQGLLCQYQLAARDEESGEFLPVGNTSSSLSEEECRRMTARLLELQRGEEDGTVWVDPSVVVEVQYADIQPSQGSASGIALRFPRLTRLRNEKHPGDADTVQRLRRLMAATTSGQVA
jgi:DNA ligase-1